MDRAKRDGSLREDIEPEDIGVLTTMISAASTPSQPDLWRRYFALFFDGLARRPEGSSPLPMNPPGHEETIEIMRGLQSRRR